MAANDKENTEAEEGAERDEVQIREQKSLCEPASVSSSPSALSYSPSARDNRIFANAYW